MARKQAEVKISPRFEFALCQLTGFWSHVDKWPGRETGICVCSSSLQILLLALFANTRNSVESQKLELDTSIIMNLLQLGWSRSRTIWRVANAIETNRQNQRQIWCQRTSEQEW